MAKWADYLSAKFGNENKNAYVICQINIIEVKRASLYEKYFNFSSEGFALAKGTKIEDIMEHLTASTVFSILFAMGRTFKEYKAKFSNNEETKRLN